MTLMVHFSEQILRLRHALIGGLGELAFRFAVILLAPSKHASPSASCACTRFCSAVFQFQSSAVCVARGAFACGSICSARIGSRLTLMSRFVDQ
jgi:hypothetical protein